MKLGLFLMPCHPPEQDVYTGAQWDLDMIQWGDELGYSEAWIGEHFTSPWEPCPAPDLLIAQALTRTKQITLAPGSHLLPYHHPAELAHRVAFLDHLAQGRFMLGIGAGGIPTDLKLFDVEETNREMMWEALDIMIRLWTEDEPFEFRGKYWRVNQPETLHGVLGPHLKPFQQPHPPIGVAAFSAKSDTLRQAGRRGLMPMSLNLNPTYLDGHWEAVEAGARSAGRIADRRDWRILRDVFVAETDEEAMRWAVEGAMGDSYRRAWLPLYQEFHWTDLFKHSPDIADSDVTPEYLAEHTWIVGSPSTVTEKLEEFVERTGDFGTLLLLTYDYSDSPEPWKESLGLLANEVMPKLSDSAAVST
ncbi:MAG: LLM class flavin-dependent oxidoreductase [Chloroflexi bacterium]|nr:LLM class flavin-dependent oxidoreductase [Chloroflexota bacterium]